MGFIDELKFDEKGLISVIAQDYYTKEVLMLAYANKESLELSMKNKKMHYFSRTRQSLWLKGESSGHFQELKELYYDCDKDAILALVVQKGVACHTGEYSCFFTNSDGEKVIKKGSSAVIYDVYKTVEERKEKPKEGSYTNYLFNEGIDKILKKIGEESTEIIIAAKNPDKDELIYEISDFIYHLIVLMNERDIKWEEVFEELKNRM